MRVCSQALKAEPVTEAQYARAAGELARLTSFDEIAHVQSELVALHTHFEQVVRAVDEHGENDGDRVYLARLMLKRAWDRYRSATVRSPTAVVGRVATLRT